MKMAGWVAMAACAHAAWAQCGMRPSAQWRGRMSPAGVTANGWLVVADPDGIELYDVATNTPRQMDRVDATNGPEPWQAMRSVVVSGDVVCAPMVDQVRLFETSGGRLVPRASFTPPGEVLRVQASGGVMYVASAGTGATTVFTSVDVHDPAAPVRLGSATVPQRLFGNDVFGRASWMYARLSGGVVCVDLTTPGSPRTTAVQVSQGSFDSIEGDRLWMTPPPGGTPSAVYDISTPSAPRFLGACTLRSNLSLVSRIGDVWYRQGVDRVVAMDLSDLSNPRELGMGPTGTMMPLVELAGGRMAAGGSAYATAAFSLLDGSDASRITTVGSIESPLGQVDALASAGSLLFVLESRPRPRLVTFDVSDASNPTRLGESDCQYEHNHDEYLAASGNLVVSLTSSLSDGGSVLRIFDVADPAHPRARGALATGGSNNRPRGLSISGAVAAINWPGGATALVDLSNPDAPTVLSTAPTAAYGRQQCSLDAGILVVASGAINSPVDVYDVSNPVAPTLLHRWSNVSATTAAVLNGGIAYGGTSIHSSALGRLEASENLTWDLGGFSSPGLVKGRTGIVTIPPGLLAAEGPGAPFLREWLSSDLLTGRTFNWTGVAEADGAIFAAQGARSVWVLPFGRAHPPVIRAGFLTDLQLHPPCLGEPYDLTVDVLNSDGATYQWYDRRDHAIPGENSPTLRIPRVNVDTTPFTTYCVISNACGSRAYPSRGLPWDRYWNPCRADFTCDRVVDADDYAAFVGAFEGGDLRADIVGDGFVDFFDYDFYVRAFEEGC